MENEISNPWLEDFCLERGKYGSSIKINDKYRTVDLIDIKSRLDMGGNNGIHKVKEYFVCEFTITRV
jgi:hypothetical protein